jgi:cation transport regulator ChaC
MMTLAYQPRLLSLHTDIGLKRGLAFVADIARPADAPPVSFEATVEFVATASGLNELCRKYLYDTVKSLKACGIRDHQLEKLAATVQPRLASR